LENPPITIITIDKLNRHSCNKCYRGILWDASILKTHAVCLTRSFINQSSPRSQAFVIPKIIIIALSLINTVDLKECLVVKKNECLHNCSIYYILTSITLSPSPAPPTPHLGVVSKFSLCEAGMNLHSYILIKKHRHRTFSHQTLSFIKAII
jgi:hypothetical protein